jgi:hypothetical protein
MDVSDGSRSTKESSRSSNSHSSRRNQQIAAAANYLAQQLVASNTAAKSGGHSSSPGQDAQQPCKNCKSTKHTTKWCASTKCYEPNCGKSFKDAAERKAHYVRMPQSERLTMCVSMDSTSRTTSNHRQGGSHL